MVFINCLTVIIAFFPVRIRSMHTSGTAGGGTWNCPDNDWTQYGCDDGQFICTCPGNGEPVDMPIKCCRQSPNTRKCGHICDYSLWAITQIPAQTCARFKNCATCKSGSYGESTDVCETCRDGWEIGNGSCNKDENECQTNNGECEHNCENTIGSFRCSCHTGFKLSDDGKSCEDIDECQDNNGGCEQSCENKDGSWECRCDNGELEIDGISCYDSDVYNMKSAECRDLDMNFCNSLRGIVMYNSFYQETVLQSYCFRQPNYMFKRACAKLQDRCCETCNQYREAKCLKKNHEW